MRTNILLIGIIVTLIIISGCVQQSSNKVTENDFKVTEKGFLEGTVSFIGIQCPPKGISSNTPKVPPCEGLYPGYEIIIYETDGKTIVDKTTSDENGYYKMSLNPGDYIIYTQSGIKNDNLKTNQVTIIRRETIKLDLAIDTGVR